MAEETGYTYHIALDRGGKWRWCLMLGPLSDHQIIARSDKQYDEEHACRLAASFLLEAAKEAHKNLMLDFHNNIDRCRYQQTTSSRMKGK